MEKYKYKNSSKQAKKLKKTLTNATGTTGTHEYNEVEVKDSTNVNTIKINSANPASIVNQCVNNNLIQQLNNNRLQTADSIINFDFKKKRVKILSSETNVKSLSNGVLYWMSRDKRVQDNWAFLFAQKLAIKNRIPLHVCFCLVPVFLDATIRHYQFILDGLKLVLDECKQLNITFHLLRGEPKIEIPKFVTQFIIGAVVCDFSPLALPLQWLDDVKRNLPNDIALCQVDAHNIVPIWITSEKQEYAARTIRKKINTKLDEYLTEFPPIIKHPYIDKNIKQKIINWKKELDNLNIDKTISKVDWIQPGYNNGINMLQNFCEKRLKFFHDKRNDPLEDALSNLSPWLNFGHISAQRCVTVVQNYKKIYPESVATFCEEAIIRRELSDNFCYYNKNYNNINGLAPWAKSTLINHKKDKREYIYSRNEFENGKTHDDLWNAAQIQLMKEGKMHGFLRMYWAKKILEWSKSPEHALEISIYLNDRYSLDGCDPNGYVGCMWSIGGIHDQGWKERSIFGKIRYMNYKGCQRKFKVTDFVSRYRDQGLQEQ